VEKKLRAPLKLGMYIEHSHLGIYIVPKRLGDKAFVKMSAS